MYVSTLHASHHFTLATLQFTSVCSFSLLSASPALCGALYLYCGSVACGGRGQVRAQSIAGGQSRLWRMIITTTADYYAATVLFFLVHRSFSAMIPLRSSNYIQRFDRKTNDQKVYEGKSLQNFLQSPNVGRTNDYSLVEIELQSPDEVDASSLQDIVHAMVKQSEHIRNASYPNPEVVPHSIFGVRNVGFENPNDLGINKDRHFLIDPSKFQNHDEKLYYLKNSKPKVYVNVRGHSGAFRKNSPSKTTSSNEPMKYLRVTPSVQRQTDWKSRNGKKNRPLKKKYRANREYDERLSRNETRKLSRLAIVYGLDDLSTTENSMVTSSELPKQIPAPPSKFSSTFFMTQTTPVQRYALKRTGTLPGYSFFDV